MFKTKLVRAVSTDGAALDASPPNNYLIIPPNTDVIVEANASTTGVDVSAGFYGYLASIES